MYHEHMQSLPISVVIPSYNHGKYIYDAITSVLDQTKKAGEIIVLDDGSKDDSLKVLAKFGDRIKLVVNPSNIGAARNVNNGIKLAQNKFVSFLNSDDVWKVDKNEFQFDYMQSNKSDVTFGLADIIDEQSKLLENPPSDFDVFKRTNPENGNFLFHFFHFGNFLCHPTLMLKKEVYLRNGLFNNKFRQLPDLDMWIRLAKKEKIEIIPKALVNFRWTPGLNTSDQTSASNFNRTQNEHLMLFKTFFDDLSISEIESLFPTETLRAKTLLPQIAKVSLSSALLLTHQNIWFSKTARIAAIDILWKQQGSYESDLMLQEMLSEGVLSLSQSAENEIRRNLKSLLPFLPHLIKRRALHKGL